MPATRGVVDVVTRVLGVCGSLQGRSANRSALDVAYRVLRAGTAIVDHFEHLDEIPAFDATRVDDPIEVVENWRRRVESADVVVIAAPEYAGGLAGVVKNAPLARTSGTLYASRSRSSVRAPRAVRMPGSSSHRR